MDIGEHFINILASVIAIEYIEHGLEKKYSGWRHWLLFAGGCAVYFAVVTVLNRFTDFEGGLCIFYGAGLTVYGMLALKGNFYNKVILSLMWILNVLFSTFIIYGVLGTFTENSIVGIMFDSDRKTIFYASLAASAVKFLMGRVIIRFYDRREDTVRKEDWLIAGALILVLLAGLNMFQLELAPAEGSGRYGRLTCLLVCQFLGVLFLERLYYKLGEYRHQKMNSEFRDKLTREISHWRHDMSGKLETLYHLHRNEQYDEVKNLLGEMCGEFEKLPELIQVTCSDGLNAALVKALAQCRENGIHFSYAVLGRPDMIDNMDMENLMWNLFANGIEACLQSEGTRILNTILCAKDGKLKIRLENTVQGSVLQDNPQLLSIKEDSLSHGFGMQTIFRILDKYKGEYLCYEDNDLLIQELSLQSSRILHENNGFCKAD